MFSGYRGLIKPPPGTPIDPFHPLSQGLVGYWPFNEGSGSRANDISGHGNHGTLMNMAPNAQGSGWGGSKFGGGLQFDGVNDYVSVSENSNSLQLGTSFTLQAWIKTTSTAENSGIIERAVGLDSWNPSILMRINRGVVNKLGAYIRDTDGTTINIQSTNDVNDGQWHLCSIVRDDTTVKIYIDGNFESSGTDAGLGVTDTTNNWFVGQSYNATPKKFQGSIDLVSGYNRALPAWEIETLHHDPFCNLLRVPVRYVSAAPAGAIMNQFQRANIGADLYNGVFA